MISQPEASLQEEIVVRKHQIDTASHTSYLSPSTGETGLTGGTRVNVTPKKHITNKRNI